MAIYHMQAKVVSRGSGRSAVAASAYMSCSRMYNDYDGIQHDYTRKQGLIYQEVMLPPMAPLEWNDREQLWNAVEENERPKTADLQENLLSHSPLSWIKTAIFLFFKILFKKILWIWACVLTLLFTIQMDTILMHTFCLPSVH